MKRALITAGLTGVITIHGLTTAYAVDYPAAPAQGGVDTGSITPGGSVDFEGSGMTPNEQIAVNTTCTADDGAATTASAPISADAAGSFAYTTTIDTAGQCTLTAQGSATTLPVTAQVTVQDPAAAGIPVPGDAEASSVLAATGVHAPLLVWAGVGLGALGVGTLAVATAGRRAEGPKTVEQYLSA